MKLEKYEVGKPFPGAVPAHQGAYLEYYEPCENAR
jgi:hypothetical protein